jgi:hypothetical protein
LHCEFRRSLRDHLWTAANPVAMRANVTQNGEVAHRARRLHGELVDMHTMGRSFGDLPVRHAVSEAA